MENKIIMVGGNDPEMANAVLNALRDNVEDATIYELEEHEMKSITNSRMHKASSEELKKYMEDEGNKQQAKAIAAEFHKRWFEEFTDDMFVPLTVIKNSTRFSWSKFNKVIATLDMFGFISWETEKKKAVRIILDDKDLLENKKVETQAMLDLCKGKLIELQGMVTLKKDKDKLETMKKRMSLTI